MSDSPPDNELPPELADVDHRVADALRPPRLTAAEAARWVSAVTARAARLETGPPDRGRRSRRGVGPWRAVLTASAVAVVAIGAWIGMRGGFSALGPAAAPATPMRLFAAAAAQRVDVTLDDGTHVLLNAGSTLRVPVDMRRSRAVELRGEARFIVERHASLPFTVRSGKANIAVLGTTFFVRHYGDDRTTRVVVVEGRVGVDAAEGRAHRGRTVLGAETAGVVTDSGDVIVTQAVSLDRYTAWTRGELVFEATPVRDIIADLNRAYGANIRLTDSTLANRSLTWNVEPARYPLAQALRELTDLLGAHIVKSGDVLTLVPGRLASRRASDPSSPLSNEPHYGR